MATWFTRIFPTDRTVPTLSGLCGFAVRGSSVLRSSSSSSSYTASSSASKGIHISSLPCARRNSLVFSSLGKMDVVAPSSAPILVMVARSGTVREATPGPAYSMTLLTPPLTLSSCSTFRIMSLADTQGGSFPFSRIRQTPGIVR